MSGIDSNLFQPNGQDCAQAYAAQDDLPFTGPHVRSAIDTAAQIQRTIAKDDVTAMVSARGVRKTTVRRKPAKDKIPAKAPAIFNSLVRNWPCVFSLSVPSAKPRITRTLACYESTISVRMLVQYARTIELSMATQRTFPAFPPAPTSMVK
jgi:hypothetical protein